MSGAEPCTGSKDGTCARIDVARRCNADRSAHGGTEVHRMSPNGSSRRRRKLRPLDEVRGQDVDVVLVDANVRIVAPSRKALVPVRHRDRDAVRFRRRRHMLRTSPRARTRTSGCDRRLCANTDSWKTISRSVPSNNRPPTDEYRPRYFRGRRRSRCHRVCGPRARRDARHEPAWTKVHVLVEATPELIRSPTATRDRTVAGQPTAP